MVMIFDVYRNNTPKNFLASNIVFVYKKMLYYKMINEKNGVT